MEGRRVILGTAAAVILALLGSLIYVGFELQHQNRLISTANRSATWTAVQVEREFLKLRDTLSSYALLPDRVSRADLELQFEVFWSRVPILTESAEGAPAMRDAEIRAVALALQAALPDLERLIYAVDKTDPRTIQAAYDGLTRFDESLATLMRRAMFADNYDEVLRSLHRENVRGTLAMFGALLSTLVLSGILLHALRRSTTLRRIAHAAERRARDAHGQLLDAIESTADGFLVLDDRSRVVAANSRLETLFPTLVGHLRPGTPLARLIELEPDLLVCNRSRPLEGLEAALPDGTRVSISQRPTARGGAVAVMRDVTGERRTQELLRSRLTAIEASDQGIAILDAEGRYSYLNPAHARIYGYPSATALLGRPWTVLYNVEERCRLSIEAMPVFAREGSWRGEAIGLRLDGSTFHQDVMLSSLQDGGMVCVVTDITERVQAEAERARLSDQFHQAQKLEGLGRLAGGIAHDFNNILAGIRGFATLLEDDLADRPEQLAFVERIQQAAGRAADLVQQILAFSRTRGSDMGAVAIGPVLEDCLAMVRASTPATIELDAPAPGDDPMTVIGNETQIGQVLMNLCVNARDAIGSHGVVRIRVDQVPGAETTGPAETPSPDQAGRVLTRADGTNVAVTGVLEPRRSYVRITVEDTGTGIPVEVMHRMFEPFFTTKATGVGTGLGLTAVHGIVGSHGGAVIVTSRPGDGTRFEVWLPAAVDGTDAEDGLAEGRAAGGTESILILDDEPMVAQATAGMLARVGYRTAICRTGEEVLSRLAAEPGQWDAVLTDQTMPGMTGIELAEHLRRSHPFLPVVLHSGYTDAVDPDTAGQRGVWAFIAKPASGDQMARVLRHVLDEGPILSRAAA